MSMYQRSSCSKHGQLLHYVHLNTCLLPQEEDWLKAKVRFPYLELRHVTVKPAWELQAQITVMTPDVFALK